MRACVVGAELVAGGTLVPKLFFTLATLEALLKDKFCEMAPSFFSPSANKVAEVVAAVAKRSIHTLVRRRAYTKRAAQKEGLSAPTTVRSVPTTQSMFSSKGANST